MSQYTTIAISIILGTLSLIGLTSVWAISQGVL